jgi:hypothetical protein
MTPIRRPRGKRPRRLISRRPRKTGYGRRPGFRGNRRCPDPNMFILMADGSQKKAGDLKVGDLIKTYHEKDLEKASKKSLVLASGSAEKYSQLRDQLESSYAKATLGEYKVEFVDIIKNVEKIKLTFEGSEIVCSLSHKFYVNDSWKEAQDMVVGDEVSGKKLVLIEDVKDGDVVHITVKDAHTYICEGLLSHNKTIRDPRIKRRPRTEEEKERIRKRKEEARRKDRRRKRRRRRPVFRRLRRIIRRLRRRRRRRISDPKPTINRGRTGRRGPVKTGKTRSTTSGGETRRMRGRRNRARRGITVIDKKKSSDRKDEVRIQPVEKDEVRTQPKEKDEVRIQPISRRSSAGRRSNRRVGRRSSSSRRGGSRGGRRGGRR